MGTQIRTPGLRKSMNSTSLLTPTTRADRFVLADQLLGQLFSRPQADEGNRDLLLGEPGELDQVARQPAVRVRRSQSV